LPPADAATWPAFRRTAQHQAEAPQAPNTLPYTYLAWQTQIGRTFASPAVADGTVYVSTDANGLRTLNLETRQLLQSFDAGDAWWTSPVLAGSCVYRVTADGTVFALDRATLRAKWQTPLGCLVTSSPVVSEGALYVGARDGVVYKLDADSGDVLWRFQTGGEVSSSPAVVRGMVVLGSGDRNLYALDARTGKERWSLSTGGAVDSSPTVAGEDVLVGSFDGCLYSAQLADGKLNWRCRLGGWVHSSPAVVERLVCVGTVNSHRDEKPTFNWVDLKTGERKASFELADAVYSSPTGWGDVVLVGCRDHYLYAFDRQAQQTQPLWSFKTRSHVHASPVVVGDTVLVASFDGNLYALRQAKPIQAWTEGDGVPRWFIAALARQLHEETADLIARAAAGEVGAELRLTRFDELFRRIKERVAHPEGGTKVLPRDVPSDHPGAPFIGYVLTGGLLAGYPDGGFHPDDPLSRYQFSAGLSTVLDWVTRPNYVWRVLKDRNAPAAQVEVKAHALTGRSRSMPADVEQTHWAYGALSSLAQLSLLPLDDEGSFRGNRRVLLRDAAAQWDLLVESVRVGRVK